MQAVLVFRAIIVLPAQPEHGAVIPPQEEAHDSVEDPGTDHDSPVGVAQGIERGDLEDEVLLLRVRGRHALGEVDGDQDGAPDGRDDGEHVSAHAQDPQEDGGIQADHRHQILLLREQHGLDPGEDALPQRRRGMFVVGDLELGSIDEGVVGTEEGEGEGQGEGDDDGGAQTGLDTGLVELLSSFTRQSFSPLVISLRLPLSLFFLPSFLCFKGILQTYLSTEGILQQEQQFLGSAGRLPIVPTCHDPGGHRKGHGEEGVGDGRRVATRSLDAKHNPISRICQNVSQSVYFFSPVASV